MISNLPNTSQQTRQLNTCLHKSIITNASLSLEPKDHRHLSLESTTSTMSTLTAAVAAASAKQSHHIVKPPVEAVVVNSIIYSKPSFCRISVDLGEVPLAVSNTISLKTKLTNGSSQNNIKCFDKSVSPSSMNLRNTDFKLTAASCFASVASTSSLDVHEDAKLYRMCTTMNGSIHHQISDLCDNILAVAGIFNNANGEQDDDSFIEFAYGDDGVDVDEDEDEDDDDDAVDFVDDEDENYDSDEVDDNDDDDYDVVDFSYDCLIEPAPKLNCDTKKKVRFDTKPTVHIMHTWVYAYRAARKGEWEMHARDRERFKLRIQRTALTLNPILEREHRQKIYDQRFANLYDKYDDQNKILFEKVSNETSVNPLESKKPHQKKKRRKRRFCKMGNKHYF